MNLPINHIDNRVHVMGITGSGKSRFLAQYCIGLMQGVMSVMMMDPHGDLTKLILSLLVEENPNNPL